MAAALDESLAELRETFRSRKTRSAQWRRSQLKALLRFVQEDEEEIFKVLEEDLGKPGGESFRDEVSGVLSCLMIGVNPTLEKLRV